MRILSPADLPHYVYEDYRRWEGRWELIEGIAYAMSPAPAVAHQKASQKIARLLDEALEGCEACRALLPVDWKITEDTIVQPDNLVVCYEPSGAYITRAPSLIFEVLSASTRQKDEQLKYRLYEAEGVKYYGLVDPDEKVVKIFELKDGRYAKIGDAEKETTRFTLADCEFAFDCSKIRD